MSIEITRNFIKKVQIKQYEPVSFCCTVKKEIEEKDFVKESARLEKMVEDQVENDVTNYQAREKDKINSIPCKICEGLPSLKSGGIREKFVGGICSECIKVGKAKLREE